MNESKQPQQPEQPAEKRKRGFAAMDPAKQRELAAAGGRKAHADGRAHQFTSKEGREAAKKSVEARRNKGILP